MKQFLILIFGAMPFGAMAQKAPKATVYNDTVFVGEAKIMLLEKNFYGSGTSVLVKDLEGNTKGEFNFETITYDNILSVIIDFTSIHQKARVDGLQNHIPTIARFIQKNNLFVNGDWDPAAVAEFVKTHAY